MRPRRLLLCLLALTTSQLALASVVINPVPLPIVTNTANQIPFTGRIPGQANGSVSLQLRIYDTWAVGSGNVLFQENQTVTVTNETFTAILGVNTNGGVDPLVLAGVLNPYLAFAFQATPSTEIGARMPLYTVPFALALSPGASVTGLSVAPALELVSNQGYNDYGIAAGIAAALSATTSAAATSAGVFSSASTTTNKPTLDVSHASTAASALFGSSTATTDVGAGVEGRVASPNGVAGVFVNSGGGDLLQARNAASGSPVFQVTNSGPILVNGQPIAQTGPKGDKGPLGPNGPQGPQGNTGPQGPAGTNAPAVYLIQTSGNGSSCLSACGGKMVTGITGPVQIALADGNYCAYAGVDGACCICAQ